MAKATRIWKKQARKYIFVGITTAVYNRFSRHIFLATVFWGLSGGRGGFS
jgi:hypothetical protein